MNVTYLLHRGTIKDMTAI